MFWEPEQTNTVRNSLSKDVALELTDKSDPISGHFWEDYSRYRKQQLQTPEENRQREDSAAGFRQRRGNVEVGCR